MFLATFYIGYFQWKYRIIFAWKLSARILLNIATQEQRYRLLENLFDKKKETKIETANFNLLQFKTFFGLCYNTQT